MSEAKSRTRSSRAEDANVGETDDAERSLGRAVAIGLPLACLVAAVIVSVAGTLGSALLVLASGALLGAIALVWASIRTLSGEAPLSVGFEAVAAPDRSADRLAEEKRRILRALKDVESEHVLGRMDDADYQALVERYRDEAKAVMRQMDEQVAPMREEAERVARQYLERHGIRGSSAAAGASAQPATAGPSRRACGACGASNETDASFCKACGAAIRTAEAP